MCGIAGYLGSKILTPNKISQVLMLMERRGPDGKNFEKIHIKGTNKYCYLLHTRLRIIDLDSRSNQPFHYNNKILIYNGEIYNYLEIRWELKKLGHQFKTSSDTEVLIHALDEWGVEKALNLVEGMWAFALFDHHAKKLILSRDPFGEKPLYVYEPEADEIYFGSEIKFLSTLSSKKFTPNQDHITRFLVNGYKSIYKVNSNFFKEVHELPRASFKEIDTGSGKNFIKKYWLPKIKVDQSLTFEDATIKAKELLINSVRLRLRADIPIAFCMSGGVDSNSLISIAKRIFDYNVHGFTITNSDSRYEEQGMINASVSELAIQHSAYPISPFNFIENLKRLVFYHDAPVFTITYYLDWLLQQAISNQGYRVSVSGTAADELFSGYFDHQLMYMYDVRYDNLLLEESIKNWKKYVAPIVRNPFLQNVKTFIDNPFTRSHIHLDNERYATYLQQPWYEDFS